MPLAEQETVGTAPGRRLRGLETLVSPYTGLVHAVHARLAMPDDGRFATAACELADAADPRASQEPPDLRGPASLTGDAHTCRRERPQNG